MSVTILLIVLLTLLGVPLVRLIDRSLRGPAFAGAAFLMGSGTASLLLFALSSAGVPWRRTPLIIAAAIVAGVAIVTLRRRREDERSPITVPYRMPAALLDLAVAAPIVGHAFFATWTGLYEWDYFGIWGLKGRFFYEVGGIDWEFVKTNISHPDYPLLVPLLFDLNAIAHGAWDEWSLGLLYTAMSCAVVLIARGTLRDEWSSSTMAAVGTAAVVFPALNLWIGLAEGVVMAFGCAGLLLIRRGSLSLGAVMLGFAAWSKNEGLALLAVSMFALAVSRGWREAVRLWPGWIVATPWLVTRAVLQLPTDFVDADILTRIAARAVDPVTLQVFRRAVPDQKWFWASVLLVLILFARSAWRSERFLTMALLLQVALFIVQGMATKANFGAHVSLTMNRIPHQLAPAFACLVALLLVPRFLAHQQAGGATAEAVDTGSRPSPSTIPS